MYDALYEPIPDSAAYLERLEMHPIGCPSAELLDELIYAHQRHVPFDNLDVSDLGAVPSLAIADLFDKIVVRRRGGYCFELNALFGALLRSLDFDARPCMARVLLRPTPYPLISHRANIVTIEGREYLADVGFGGPMPTFAPLMEDGATRTQFGHTFTMRKRDASWWDVGYTGTSEEERAVLRVCTMPVEEHDFIPLSFFQSQNPESVFRLNRMANIKTEDGALDLRNLTFTEYHGAQKVTVELESRDAADELLREKFGIEPPTLLQ